MYHSLFENLSENPFAFCVYVDAADLVEVACCTTCARANQLQKLHTSEKGVCLYGAVIRTSYSVFESLTKQQQALITHVAPHAMFS